MADTQKFEKSFPEGLIIEAPKKVKVVLVERVEFQGRGHVGEGNSEEKKSLAWVGLCNLLQ